MEKVRGAIFHYMDMPFCGGFAKNKYLVLLNTPNKSESLIFVKATSQQHDKPNKPGCLKKHHAYFIKLNFLT